MPVIKVKLKDGDISFSEKIDERIRTICGMDKEDFYGMCGRGADVKLGFLNGLWIGGKSEDVVGCI